MRDPDKYTWFDSQQNHIPPRRAPRLPRNHPLMRPEISRGQRIARAITICAIVIYFVAMYGPFR